MSDEWSKTVETKNGGSVVVCSQKGGHVITLRVSGGGLAKGIVLPEDVPAVAHLCASFFGHQWRVGKIGSDAQGRLVFGLTTFDLGGEACSVWKALGEALKDALEHTKKPKGYRVSVPRAGDGSFTRVFVVSVTDRDLISITSGEFGPDKLLKASQAEAIACLSRHTSPWSANGMSRGQDGSLRIDPHAGSTVMNAQAWLALGAAINGAINYIKEETT